MKKDEFFIIENKAGSSREIQGIQLYTAVFCTITFNSYKANRNIIYCFSTQSLKKKSRVSINQIRKIMKKKKNVFPTMID